MESLSVDCKLGDCKASEEADEKVEAKTIKFIAVTRPQVKAVFPRCRSFAVQACGSVRVMLKFSKIEIEFRK
jgi:hypothetical protein